MNTFDENDMAPARIAAMEAALGWISIREAIRTGNVEAAKEWATRGEARNAEQAARIAELEREVARKNASLLEVALNGAAADQGTSRVAVALGIDPDCSLAKCAQVAADMRQDRTDAVCHYRNLAITLGAKPDDMLGVYDRKLCAEWDPKVTHADVVWHARGMWGEFDAAEERVAELERQLAETSAQRDTYAAALREALDGWASSERAIYAHTGGGVEGARDTILRLRVLLPPV